MSDRMLFTGEHPETLSSGRSVAPGDRIPVSALDPDDAQDKRLVDDGLLIDDREIREEAKADAAGEEDNA